MKLYRDFTSQEEIDAHYSVLSNVPDADDRIRGWAERSAEAARRLECRLDVRYGPTVAEYCDIYPAGAGAPVHVFLHGGYWRRFSARDHAFVVPQLVAAGVSVVMVNYALCPAVSLDEIVRQVRAAVAWTYGHAAEFGADPTRLTLSGHSAGGHLTAMALLTDWVGDYALPADIIKGAVAISGLYDLGFLPYCYVQPKVQATWDQVARLSPLFHLPEAAPPLLVAVGGDEPDEFRRQSRDFHAAWHAAHLPGDFLEVPGKHHLSVLEELESADRELTRRLVEVATR